jgi:hypothetical protein
MLGREVTGRLELDNDSIKYDKVRDVGLLQRLAFVMKGQCWRGDERDVPRLKLECEALLIDRLQKPGTQLLAPRT